MEKCESAHRVRSGVENQLRPLRAASIFERNDAQATTIEQIRERLHPVHRSATRLEGSNPGVALNVVANVAGFDHMARRECGPSNHVTNVLGKNFLVANSILHGANSGSLGKKMSCGGNGGARVNALCGYDPKIANGNFMRVGGGLNGSGKIGGAGNAQPVLLDGLDVLLRNIVGMHFRFALARQMRCKNAAHRAAAHDAYLHRPSPGLSVPSKNFQGTSARFSPSLLPTRYVSCVYRQTFPSWSTTCGWKLKIMFSRSSTRDSAPIAGYSSMVVPMECPERWPKPNPPFWKISAAA